MEQIGEGDVVSSKILLLRKNSLVSDQCCVKILEVTVDYFFIGRTKALARVEDLLHSDAADIGIEVGGFQR